MKQTGILFILLLFAIRAFGQQIPFQGRLLENGTPITGQRNFTFSIIAGTINWSETQNNVVVTNGLYALVLGQNTPLPTNLFEGQNSVPLAIQVNGQDLPTTTLYAPFESDPSIPTNLKDGIEWDEISNKPTLDESPTNELQNLSIDGNELSLTNGNTVTLPSTQNSDTLAIGEERIVTSTILSQEQFDGTTTRNFLWQSFFITQDAKLIAIELSFANSVGVDIRFRLYPGEGTNQQFLWTNDFAAANFGPSLEIQSFPVNTLTDIQLDAGTIYTFYVQGIGDDLLFRRNSNNPYSGGTTNVNSTTDAIFRIIVETEEGYTFEVRPTQTSIRTPLTVEDRIKDKTGFIMPVGTVVPFAGAILPEGWLLCDGSAVNRALYPDLFAAIGTVWGIGNGASTFNLPDLRGQFLRGVDGSAEVDPDKNDRTAFNGGNAGNNVGSYQADTLGMHNHSSIDYRDGTFANGGGSGMDVLGYGLLGNADIVRPINLTGDTGGNETRPVNAYVNYIIKY